MITIATRGSVLALWQAKRAQALLTEHGPHASRLEIIRTVGDRVTDVPLSQIGDRGLFTRELDNALLEKRADCAVHSLKDVPTVLPEGLAIVAVLERADPRDAWLARDHVSSVNSLPAGSRVGTSSLRRRALLSEARNDLDIVDVRGNLDTRLEKLAGGEYDALVLAHAGIERLGRTDAVTSLLEPPAWLPAPGQGAIAVVARADDEAMRSAMQPMNHYATSSCVRAERALLRSLEGGCQVPIGALAALDGDGILLHAFVASPDGRQVLRDSMRGDAANPEELGTALAQRMVGNGAADILAAVREQPRHSVYLP